MAIRGDVLDLTDLQRRGLLKKAEEIRKKEEGVKQDSGGYVDFSSWGQQAGAAAPESAPSYSSDVSTPSHSQDAPTQADNAGGSMFGFLDSLAGSASNNDVGANNYGSSSVGSGGENIEIQGLKNKIEDLEYKLDRLMEKIAKMEGN